MPSATDLSRTQPGQSITDVSGPAAIPALDTRGNEPPRIWRLTTVASTAAILPAVAVAHLPLAAALFVATIVAAALAVVAWRTSAAPLAISFVPATILASSGVIPGATYFLPAATLGLALTLLVGAELLLFRRFPPIPSRVVVSFVILYIAATAVSTIFSIRLTTSIPYLLGIAIILVVSVWLGPWVLLRSNSVTHLFALTAGAGVAVTFISLVLAGVGPILWFDRWLGVYLVNELTVLDHPTGLILLRTTGPFLAAGGQALTLVPAILSLLALRLGVSSRARQIASAVLVVLVLGLLSTMARSGWVAVVVGSAVIAFHDVRRRRIDRAAVVVALVVGTAFVAMLFNVVGADYRPDLTEARNVAAQSAGVGRSEDSGPPLPPETATDSYGGLEPRVQTRGGSELGGRLELWSSSLRAIADSPWVGYGPGTNAIVLDPYLDGVSRRLVGLTSHNTWLRTWLELGILGLLAFFGFLVASVIAGIRRIPHGLSGQPSLAAGTLAILVGLVAAQAFETFLLGGVSLPSFVWSLSAGLVAASAVRRDDASVQAQT